MCYEGDKETMRQKQTEYLSELKDAPSVDVFRLVKLHCGILP